MAGSVQIDGIRVYGRLQDVTRADIRVAIDSSGAIKPHEIEVVSSREMHAYYKTRELGWTPLEKLPVMQPADKKFSWSPNGLSAYAPQVLHAIRTAEEVYVFPVVMPKEPRRDDKHIRSLSPEDRRRIVRLLGREQNWWHGAYHIVVPGTPPTDVGFIFRSKRDELVLFFLEYLVDGALNGQNVSGSFGNHSGDRKRLETWKHRYAAAELAVK